MTRLNPCPKCGSEPEFLFMNDKPFLFCAVCDLKANPCGLSANEAVNAWNRITSEQKTKTLRDEFAMAVISGYMATESCLNSESAEWAVTHSYEIADLMLKERSK